MLSSHDNILPDDSAPRAVSRPFNIGRGAAARPDRGRRMVTRMQRDGQRRPGEMHQLAARRARSQRMPHWLSPSKTGNLKLKCRSEDAASPGGATEPYA